MRVGVDLGGTKIEGIALADDGRELARLRVPTPAGDYHATLRAIVEVVERLESTAGARSCVGLGMPGAVSPASGLIKNSNSTSLNGQALQQDLELLLERPLRVANDANCFALSEARDGAGTGAAVVFGVIIGTGTGGGLVVDGRALVGANAIAGEWGHNALPWPRSDEWPGPACYCGRTGCVERFLSGPGMAEQHALRTGERCEPKEIAERAFRDASCEATLQDYFDRMARALAALINIVDPDVVVLGGGMSRLTRLYTEIPARWSRWVFSDRVDTRLEPPRHGDASGVRGAAWLWEVGET